MADDIEAIIAAITGDKTKADALIEAAQAQLDQAEGLVGDLPVVEY